MRLTFINKLREFEESFLYILKISDERLVFAIKSILFIKRIINRKVDINNNNKIIILLLNVLNNFISFELDIKFGEVLKGI